MDPRINQPQSNPDPSQPAGSANPVDPAQPQYGAAQTDQTQYQQPAVDPTYQEYVNQYYQQYYPEYAARLAEYQAYYQQQADQQQPTAAEALQHQPIDATPTQVPEPVAPPVPGGQSHYGTYNLPTDQSAPTQAGHQPLAHYEPTAQPQNTVAPQPTAPSKPGLLEKLKSEDSTGRKTLPRKLRPLAGAIAAGLLVFALFNSQLIIGQLQYLISPQAGAEAPAADEAIGPEPAIIIPKINVNAPVVYDEPSFEEGKVQKALERGVVHYGTTSVPGQPGNNVIVGHSSNNWWASGKYKFAFVLLDKLEVGDSFVLHYEGKRYVYEVNNKVTVAPNDVSVLQQNTPEPTATLITCTPPGTSLKRLVVQGKQISPKPSGGSVLGNALPEIDNPLPGNTPSLWQQIKERFGGD